MNAMKKTALATAVLMSMGAGAAQAATLTYDFSGAFVMFDGYDSTFSNPSNVVDNGAGIAGDPATGTMSIDSVTGMGTGTFLGSPFFGSAWTATNVNLTTSGASGVSATMKFNWGAPAAADNSDSTDYSAGNGVLGTGTCGVTNCNIPVDVSFNMAALSGAANFNVADTVGDKYTMTTILSSMPVGPFAGFQPTFNGTMTVTSVPVPATAWIVGSGLLGLMGVGAVRRKKQLTA